MVALGFAAYLLATLMPSQGGPSISLIEEPVGVNEEATCVNAAGAPLAIREATLSPSRTKIIDRRYYTISGNNIIISDEPNQRINIIIYDALFLVRARSRDGLVIFHAAINDTPYIYWIDKNADGLARNGLLDISGNLISIACEGTIYR